MHHSLAPAPGLFTFGAMSIGVDEQRLEPDIALVRAVMESGQWIHCSPTYHRGFSFMVLRCAFDEAPSQRPPLIVKIRDASPRWLRFETEDCCRRLGVDGIDIAQLVSMQRDPGCMVDQLIAGAGPLHDELASLRERGLVRQAAIYCDQGNAEAAVRAAAASELIEGVTGYWNAHQDCLTAQAWASLRAADLPLVAIRSLAGGLADPERRAAHEALARDCDCADPVELALRLAVSEPSLVTTIGGTGSLTHWQALRTAASAATALTTEALERIRGSQEPVGG